MDVLVIDQGSCITYDLITGKGVFEGGIISPGLDMRLKAMHEFTANLPLLSANDHSSSLIGKSTKECMKIGAIDGLRNEILGFLASFNKKYSDLQIVVTGGDKSNFDSTFKNPIFASSKIVLEGLYAIWKFNSET